MKVARESCILLAIITTWILMCVDATAAFQVNLLQGNHRSLRNRSSFLLRAFNGGNENEETSDELSTRRSILSSLTTIPILLWTSQPALAAPPVTIGEADGLGARAARAIRPKPPKILRPKLNQDFAVLLMRSSYNALDKIDCVAMDQFQRDFFLIRQAEYEPYVNALGPGIVQQGVLTDPYYFDFISFAQYATISREISLDPPMVFEEQQPVEVGEGQPQKFVSAVIKRDVGLKNDMLASEHDSLVGNAILDRLEETFRDTGSSIPKLATGSSTEAIETSLSQIAKLFLVNGFAWDGSVSASQQSPNKAEFCIEMISPATLWSGKALQSRRAVERNDFLLKTVKAFLRRSGYAIESSFVKYDGNTEASYVTVRL